MKTNEKSNAKNSIHLLKTATCPSLSGKSKLTYQLGQADDGQLHLRVVNNSSSGCFNDEWVSLRRVAAAFDQDSPGGEPVTSGSIDGLFEGKSQNTAGFIFAALKSEGFVQASTRTKRRYDRLGPDDFKARAVALLANEGVTAARTTLKVSGKGKPAVTKKAGKATNRKT